MMRQRSNKVSSDSSTESSLGDDSEILYDNKKEHGKHVYKPPKESDGFTATKMVLYFLPALLIISLIVKVGNKGGGLSSSSLSSFSSSFDSRHLLAGNPNRGMQTVRKFTQCPPTHAKTYFVRSGPMQHTLRRALNANGWRRVDKASQAQFIWTKAPKDPIFSILKPWQRYCHHPRSDNWDAKDIFASTMMKYQRETNKPVFIPETYDLDDPSDLKRFHHRLQKGGGMDLPWVLKEPTENNSKGVTMLGPHSKQLKHVIKKVKASYNPYIIQRYICNEMTYDGHKMDFRVYWMIASLDPLIVLYHDGYIKIASGQYDEQDFSDSRSQLTVNHNRMSEGKGSWQDFENRLNAHAAKHTPHITNPMEHVRNQVKHSLAQMVSAFSENTLTTEEMNANNGYGIYGADFIIDNDLDTWFIEPQRGPSIDESYMFRLEQNNIVYNEMVAIVGEVIDKQEQGLPIMPLEAQKHYHVIYEDGWLFEYHGYHPVENKKPCLASTASHKKAAATMSENEQDGEEDSDGQDLDGTGNVLTKKSKGKKKKSKKKKISKVPKKMNSKKMNSKKKKKHSVDDATGSEASLPPGDENGKDIQNDEGEDEEDDGDEDEDDEDDEDDDEDDEDDDDEGDDEEGGEDEGEKEGENKEEGGDQGETKDDKASGGNGEEPNEEELEKELEAEIEAELKAEADKEKAKVA